MSEIPSTLEQLTYEILQGDLSQNPYLQPHLIASKDKALKTQAKKIIPAINELLKRIGICEETMQGFTAEVDKKITEELTEQLNKLAKDLQTKLEASYKEEIEKRFEALEKTVNESMAEKVQVQVQNAVNASQSIDQGGSGDMKKVLVEKVTLAAKESVTLKNICASELFPENIICYCYGSLQIQPFYNCWDSARHNGISISTPAEPINVHMNKDESVTITNTASSNGIQLYIYKYE